MSNLIVVEGFEFRIEKDLGSLEQLQALVRGYIEPVIGEKILSLGSGYKAIFKALPYKIMGWIDEEGKMKDNFATFALGFNREPFDILVGPVVLCEDLGDETGGFSLDQTQQIADILVGAGYCYTGAPGQPQTMRKGKTNDTQ